MIKKRILSLLVSVSVLMGIMPAYIHASEVKTIKNIIYMIPDGGGYPVFDFANLVKKQGGFSDSIYPYKTKVDKGEMNLKPYLAGSARTAPHFMSGEVTDSAAAGTALATGVKTVNGYVGIDHNKKPRVNILEAAQSKGKATGLISTYEWVHATPATFSAHAIDRNDYKNIYRQIENKGIDVVLGTGYGAVSSYGGTIQTAAENGYNVINKKSDLVAVKAGDKLWGNMANPNFSYDINLSADEANLAQMTRAAITALSGDEDGFFLMIEGGKVDTGGHSNDAVVTTSEYLAFDAAFGVALEYAMSRDDTLIICTPDHDTGGMIFTGADEMESEVTSVINGIDPSTIEWETSGHSAHNVPVWMYIPEGIEGIEGLNSVLGDTETTRSDYVIENTDIAPYLANLMGADLDALSDEMFVDVTKIGRYIAATGKFVFANGDKYVYVNDSVYYKDGVAVSMGNKEAIAINNKFYVPAEIVDEEDWNYVAESGGFTGSGTKNDPYIIDDALDIIEFTGKMMEGETFEGKYLRQEADIDLSGETDYKGIGKGYTFAGIYDGNSHTVNLDLNTNTDGCLFPYVEGTIMNLGTTGSITSTGGYSGGVARSLRSTGKIVNCFSTVEINCVQGGGITSSNYGKIENTYFGGSITGSSWVEGFASTYDGTYENCYYNISCDQTSASGLRGMTEEEFKKDEFAEILNIGRSAAALTLGIDEDELSYWNQDAGGFPYLYNVVPIVNEVKITPKSVTLKKGEGIQFEVEVLGQYGHSEEVVWSIEPESKYDTIIYDDGYLVIDAEETQKNFVVMAKSKQDGSKVDTCTVTVSELVNNEEDGSRARPYLIENEEDFHEFTNNVLAGNNYEGKYIRQTADIDMANYSGYVGMGSSAVFAGIYDGGGHTINLKIASTDGCAFPYTTGIIMNLGTTGEVCNETYAGGICRSIRTGAKMINCWSSCKVSAGNGVGGLSWSNYGLLTNSFFCGDVNTGYVISSPQNGSVMVGNYYLGTEYIEDSSNTQITEEQMINNLYGWLNEGREEAASRAGLLLNDIRFWLPKDGEEPMMAVDSDNIIFGIANNEIFVYPNVSINGADIYVAVYDGEDNLLRVEKQKVFVSKKTTYTKQLKNQYSPEENVKIMLWDDVSPLEMPVYY